MGKASLKLDYPMPRPTWEDVNQAKAPFWPSADLEAWIRFTFIENGPLYNPDHEHLQMASIGVLFAAIEQKDRGRRILGQCEMGDPGGKVWRRRQRMMLLEQWFNGVPDFVITLDASFLMDCDNAAACAVIEHELYHAGQKKDQYGSPLFDKDDLPIFWMRPHDIEEFHGVIERYGAWNMDLSDVQRALMAGPSIEKAHLDGVCGCGAGFGR